VITSSSVPARRSASPSRGSVTARMTVETGPMNPAAVSDASVSVATELMSNSHRHGRRRDGLVASRRRWRCELDITPRSSVC